MQRLISHPTKPGLNPYRCIAWPILSRYTITDSSRGFIEEPEGWGVRGQSRYWEGKGGGREDDEVKVDEDAEEKSGWLGGWSGRKMVTVMDKGSRDEGKK